MFESQEYPEGVATPFVFHQSNIPLLLEITEPYVNLENTDYHDSYHASTIIRNSHAFDEDNNPVLRIDLDFDEYATFVSGMNEALSSYMRRQLIFWKVITNRFPSWLMSESISVDEPINAANLDDITDVFEGQYMKDYESKMKRIFNLATIFRKEYNAIYHSGEVTE